MNTPTVLTSTLQKLIAAYEGRDYSVLTLIDLFHLVEHRMLNPETALRLARESHHVC